MKKSHAPPRAWTSWGQSRSSTVLLALQRKPCRRNPRRLRCLPYAGRGHSGNVAIYLAFFPQAEFAEGSWLQPQSATGCYLPSHVHVCNLPSFCRSPCSGPISVLQVGMPAAYQVGGFGFCVEFGERFCSKLLYFLACKLWEHMAHCLQNADILKLGEE